MQNQQGNKVQLVVGLVLAAGFSRRYGADKRLARLSNGQTLLAASLELPCSQLQEVWVVVRPDDEREQLAIPHSCKLVRSENTLDGMGYSLASGVRAVAVSSSADAVAIFLGDMPWISSESLHRLIAQASSEHIVVPTYQGQPGHPVIFGRAFWSELQALTGDTGAKAVIRAHPQALSRIELDDPSILQDVDTPLS